MHTQTQMFALTGKGLEKIEPNKGVPLYTRVYSFGYAMSELVAAVITLPDENGMQKCVSMCEYEPKFCKIDRYSRPIEKKFGIGCYYDLSHTFEESEVLEAIKRAEAQEVKDKAKAKEAAEAKSKELNELPTLYPHLTINRDYDQKTTKANIAAELKKAFPAVKFSLKKRSYDSYNVCWVNGPTVAEVDAITDKFEHSSSDITGDFRDYTPSNFNNTFGGFKYIFTDRDLTSDIYALKDEFITQLGEHGKAYPYEAEQTFYKVARGASFPPVFTIKGIKHKDNFSGTLTDSFEFILDIPEAPAPRPEPKTSSASIKHDQVAINGNFEVLDYSEKAIAVFGDTKAIKDKLKEMGGRFNFALTHPISGARACGWVFPKSKGEELRKMLTA